MARFSRRKFLKLSAAGLGSIAISQFLDACSPASVTVPTLTVTANTPTAQPEYTETPQSPTATLPSVQDTVVVPPSPTVTSTSTATPEPIPDLVVAHGPDPEALIRQGLAALGGIQQFVAQGANVIVKPNICAAYPYQNAATTNPWVVGTLVKMCFEAGAATVRVMDYPFASSAKDGYSVSGIRAQVEAAGGEMSYMTPFFKYVKTPIPDGKSLKEIAIFEDILKADLVINVPIAKDHSSTRLTLGMKNLMGVILDRNTMHVDLGQRIADLASVVRPKLTIIDAIRILVANGPTGGGNVKNAKEMDTVIFSKDIVAADSYATSLFGLKPKDIAYITAGEAMGLGTTDLQSLKIKEISVNS